MTSLKKECSNGTINLLYNQHDYSPIDIRWGLTFSLSTFLLGG